MSEQLALPIGVRPNQIVDWANMELIEKRKFFGLLGKRTVAKTLWQDGRFGTGLSMTRIDVEDINRLEDPDLRYALRFQAAADSMGWIGDGSGSSHSQYVWVGATDEGSKSRMLDQATYSGVAYDGVDTFLEDLRSFAPHENH